ncbi:MAG: cytochrome C [Bacteroidetes bacterium HGW-Bacteroidetes-9]|jgi:nitrate/TMAO reductase-like tetraheme cytochrome c subunit|nr:MAG: cytochrome C [Bacteroidetes bacterium HGW-Bacteroidetes-9]
MKAPKNLYNWLSLTGFILVANSLFLILILFLFSIFSEQSNSYLGLYIYIILPAFLVLGLILIPLGIVFRIRKNVGAQQHEGAWPVLDFNQPKHRASVFKIVLITMVLIVISSMGSYQAFQYTESVEFCGKLCHKVMEPEYVTYQHSAHARVTCVECHVGEGADWYIRSKMSGLYQVYSVLFNKYPRPIATPIHNLRPARETCEKCHWPEKFYARKLRSQRSYLTDSANTEWNISLLMKIGPEFSPMGLTEGIHWHINKDFKIEYVSDDKNRESIPWVKLTNLKTGEVKIFMDEDNPLDKIALDTLDTRSMDCMDCHNRPSHLYKSAPDYIDNALISGLFPKDIPYIKKAAMEALKIPYTDKDSAMKYIKDVVLSFYMDQHPEVVKKEELRINKAIEVIQGEYKLNAFPDMRADATQYLNHIGHLESDGCFRCHSDRHKTSAGETISRDCNICHTIIAQGPTGNITSAPINTSLDYVHPVGIRGTWKTAFCSECHKVLYE